MTARRYAELLSMARAALDMRSNIILNTSNCGRIIGFQPNDCLYMAGHFSVNAVEAFVNHLGYIFDDDWRDYESKNFWKQYKRVIEKLKKLGVDVSQIAMTPYADFKK